MERDAVTAAGRETIAAAAEEKVVVAIYYIEATTVIIEGDTRNKKLQHEEIKPGSRSSINSEFGDGK